MSQVSVPNVVHTVSVESEKKDKKGLIVLVTVLITLLVVAIIAGVVLIMNSEDKQTDNSTENGTETITKSGEEEEPEESATDLEAEEKLVKETVYDYMDAMIALDEEACDYVQAESSVYDDTEDFLDEFSFTENFSADMDVPAEQAKEIDELAENFLDNLLELIEYEITDTEVENDGEKATVYVEVTMPDLEKMDGIVDGVDFDTLLSENMSEQEISNLENATEDEVNELTVKLMGWLFEEVLEQMEDTTEEIEKIYKLEKNSGEWIIVGEK